MSAQLIWDNQLLHRYNTKGPRYTSYPTALEFHDGFKESSFRQALQQSRNPDLALYIHIPFCHELCYYCGCNKIVTRHQHKADEYLQHLLLEIAQRASLTKNKRVQQLHLGGGTPSFLTHAQMQQLVDALRQHFNFADDAECSIEIDPRSVDVARMAQFHQQGFNRVSFGVQDITSEVQIAINRQQDSSHIAALVHAARDVGMQSVNLDLVYGLPHQTSERFADTLDFALSLSPDRVSLFSYAHMPSVFAAQRKIKDEWLPGAEQKAGLFKSAAQRFLAEGYQYLGLDHFAKPTDELSIAMQNKCLHRNFQGYTTHEHCDLLGLGVSSISALDDCFSQNHKDLKDYYQAIKDVQGPVARGLALTQDDQIRQQVIKSIMCNLCVDLNEIGARFHIDVDTYFTQERLDLADMEQDGIVELSHNILTVTPRGRLLIRNIAMVFDQYLINKQSRFSATI